MSLSSVSNYIINNMGLKMRYFNGIRKMFFWTFICFLSSFTLSAEWSEFDNFDSNSINLSTKWEQADDNIQDPTASNGKLQLSLPSTAAELSSYLIVKNGAQYDGLRADFAVSELPFSEAGVEIFFECSGGYEGWVEIYSHEGNFTASAVIEQGDSEVWRSEKYISVSPNQTISLGVIIELEKVKIFIGEDDVDESPVIAGLEPQLFAIGAWKDPVAGASNATVDNVETFTTKTVNDYGDWVLVDSFPGSQLNTEIWEESDYNTVSPTVSSGRVRFNLPPYDNDPENDTESYIMLKDKSGIFGIQADFKAPSITSGEAGLELYFETTDGIEGWFEIVKYEGNLYIGVGTENIATEEEVWSPDYLPNIINSESNYILSCIFVDNRIKCFLDDDLIFESPYFENLIPQVLSVGAWNDSTSNSFAASADNFSVLYDRPEPEDVYEVSLGSFANEGGTFGVECDVETSIDIASVTLTTPADEEVNLVLEYDGDDYFWWELEDDLTVQTVLNGNYQITVRNKLGGEFTTIIPYAKADMMTPLPSISTASSVTSPLNLDQSILQASEDFIVTWDEPDSQANMIVLELEKHGEDYIEIDREYFGDGSESDGPFSTRQENLGKLDEGEWELYLITAYEVHQTNNDGIEYSVWRAVENVYEFDVISGNLVESSVVDDIGGAVSQSVDSVESGGEVTFVAVPDEGYEVEGWYMNDDSNFSQLGGLEFVVSNIQEDLSVAVKFKKKVYTVNFVIEEGGTLTVDGTPEQSPYSVEHGASLENILAIANEGVNFFGFKGDYISKEDTIIELIVTSDMTIEVAFAVDADGNGLPDEWEDEVNTSGEDFEADGDDDEDGISNLDEFLNGTDPFGFDIVMNRGWNLVHIPRLLEDSPNDLSSLFTKRRGEMWSWAPGGGFYNQATSIIVGSGVWVFWDGDREIISVPGTPIDGQNITLHKGWNLVGTIYKTTLPANDAVNLIFFWDSELQVYETLDNFELMPGVGYWIESRGEYSFDLGE